MICCAVVSIPGSGPRDASRRVGRVVWNIHPNSIAGMGNPTMDNSLATSRDRLGRVWNRSGFEDDRKPNAAVEDVETPVDLVTKKTLDEK